MVYFLPTRLFDVHDAVRRDVISLIKLINYFLKIYKKHASFLPFHNPP